MFPGYPLQFSVITAFTRGLWQFFPSINSPTARQVWFSCPSSYAGLPSTGRCPRTCNTSEAAMAHSQEAHFRHHLLRVSEHLDTCDRLVGHIDQVDTEVANMLDKWKSMEEGGKSLQDASQKSLDERVRIASLTHTSLGCVEELDGCVVVLQDQLAALQTAIGTTLEYFQELEHATRNSITLASRSFSRPTFSTWLSVWTSASSFSNPIETTKKQKSISYASSNDVSRRLFEQDVSDTAQMHLLCTRFTTVAGQLAPLLGEFECRAHSHPEELGALLSECHVAYFGARKNLLVSRLTEQIRGLDPTRTGLVELTRAGCSYLKQELYTWKLFSDYLYDDLRPRILHEPRLTVLCETLDDENEEKNDDLGRLHIHHLLQMVLQDAQTRLFFKAQAVIQSDIRYYTPTAKDLAYPDKLAGSTDRIRNSREAERLFEGPGLNQRETWYPTLSKAVWGLSQLHDFPTIFYDLGHEAVSLCHGSLLSAAGLVRAKSGFDGQLFLVCYLLILKEITRNLDLAQNDELQAGVGGGAADQYGVADMLSSVLSRTSTLLPGSLFTSLAGMRAEHLADARRGIDQDLKHACESVISAASEPLCTPLRAFTGRPASAAEAALLDEAFRNACTSDLRASIARVQLYVPDVRTAGVLVQHALDRVEDAYSAFSLAARQVGARAGKGQDCLMDDGLLKQLLQDVREDGGGSPPART
ncbi:hypothetical protein BGW80DRAFT_1564998 [Lactifluus volemus]|nr:hypothetical protein BGW80DRAFT_1564998 [Lactifluus volemus]